MTFRQFLSARRRERRARRADKVMTSIFGEAWKLNRNGIHEMLSSPAPVVVLDSVSLDEIVSRKVAEALANFSPAEQEFEEAPAAVYEAPVEAWPELEQPSEDPPRDTSILAESVGNGTPPAQPVQPPRVQPAATADEKRRAFIRDFLKSERAARGLGIPS